MPSFSDLGATVSSHMQSKPKPASKVIDLAQAACQPKQGGPATANDLPSVPRAPIDGWPSMVDQPAAWDGTQFRHDEQYTYLLSQDEVEELEHALAHFRGLGLDGSEVSQATFPLPTLAWPLRALAEDLHSGRGFFAVRGLDPKRYSAEDNVLLFLGVSSYVGEKRGLQNDKGHIFAHIREAKYMTTAQNGRPIRDSNTSSLFHNDLFCDILAMQTRGLPAEGGNHIVTSVAKVYNELVKSHPKLIPILAAPEWPFDTRGVLKPPSIRPLLYYHHSRVLMSLVPYPLLGLPEVKRNASLPLPTSQQRQALATVQRLATQYSRPLTMQLGDLTFVNNLTVLHAREGFNDAPPNQVRYLVRMWLKNPDLALVLPPELEGGNKRTFGEEDVGIREDWNIAYKPRIQFEVTDRLSP